MIKQLKNSILQLAIRGKLAKQCAADGTAEDLYNQIQAEKASLVKSGKLKKDKPLPAIDPKEIPFEIPQGWKWVRLGEVAQLLSGQDLPPTCYNDVMRGMPYLTGASNLDNGNVIINRWTETPRSIAMKGDLLLTCKGTVGKTAILEEKEVHIARQIMAIKPVCVNTYFIKFFIESQIDSLKNRAKSMIPGIERANVLNLLLPLPPLAEQKRIVEKLESLLSLVARLAEYS